MSPLLSTQRSVTLRVRPHAVSSAGESNSIYTHTLEGVSHACGLAIMCVPALIAARSLELRTGFDSLLPETKPSVVELKRVARRTAGISTLAIVIEGDDS